MITPFLLFYVFLSVCPASICPSTYFFCQPVGLCVYLTTCLLVCLLWLSVWQSLFLPVIISAILFIVKHFVRVSPISDFGPVRSIIPRADFYSQSSPVSTTIMHSRQWSLYTFPNLNLQSPHPRRPGGQEVRHYFLIISYSRSFNHLAFLPQSLVIAGLLTS